MPARRTNFSRCLLAIALSIAACAAPEPRKSYPPPEAPRLRAPAIPLIVQSPVLNVWMFGDRITDDVPKLWNGQVKGMAGMIRIDGKPYRFLGMPGSILPAMRQDAVRVWPTRTEIDLSAEDVRLKLEFLSPLDPRDLELLSWPLAYVRAELSSRTGRHLHLHLDITGEWAVGSTDRRITFDGLFRIRPSQPRIFRETSSWPDWGDVHWVPVDPAISQYGVDQEVRQAFAEGSTPRRDVRYPRPANEDWPVFAHSWDLGSVKAPVARRAVLAQVRREAVNFFGVPGLSYWTKSFDDGAALVARAAAACDEIRTRALALDAEVLSRAREAGGEPLAALASLVFRQSFAGGELVLVSGRPMLFSKSFDGSGASPVQSIETLYATAPALLAFNPKLLGLQLVPILEAHRRGDWQEPHAMRDLGLYPNATGLIQPDEAQVESTAMLVLLTALARQDDPRALDEFRPVVQKLARFLQAALSRPATSETPALLAALLALSTLPEFKGDAASAIRTWGSAAESGDHTLLRFGDHKSWTLQPHLFAERLLRLGLLPDTIVERESAFLRSRTGRYGPPLDSGHPVLAVDAVLRLSGLTTKPATEAVAADLLRAMSETPSRVPPADRLDPDTARVVGGQARSTLGSVFAPLLLRERRAER